jgi:hypothetical protein
MGMTTPTLVIPAKAGIPLLFSTAAKGSGTPAFAGVTGRI